MGIEERRKAPRIEEEGLSLRLNTKDFNTVTHTLNISASGVYCKVDKEMPLMSRVELILMIPDVSREDKKINSVAVEGVVVREHPVVIDGKIKHYDVAIFFENLSPKNLGIISNYVARDKTARR